ncbi:hypothetical protein [Succinimonas sp.]|uniref:hypothetical protein n=1 Tax=Succinimonas sp. TaxID=1936151 RepID=UPI0038685407
MEYKDVDILTSVSSQEGKYKVNFFITNNSLFSEDGEILAQYNKETNELDIILDKEASEVLTYEEACKDIIGALESNKFVSGTFSKKSLYRAIVKPVNKA